MSGPSSLAGTSLSNRQSLIDVFAQAAPASDNLQIGVEHEKIPFSFGARKPVPYEDSSGRPAIREVLMTLEKRGGWSPDFEGANVIGLRRKGVGITLEPGCQVEHSGAPLPNVHESARETDELIREASQVARGLGLGLLALGYQPIYEGRDLPFMRKSRYEEQRKYFRRTRFSEAFDSMSSTASAQVNLGYTSEENMVQMLRVSLSLQPIAVALFANSPFNAGKPSGYHSYRSHEIHNTFGGRCGYMLPIAFDEGFGFEMYADYALKDMPMLGFYEGNVFSDAGGGMFGDFMAGNLAAAPGRRPTMGDWVNHLNTIYPEVRLRPGLLEMRGADAGPAEMIKALSAFWTGLLYDKQSLDGAYEMVRDWTQQDREGLRVLTPVHGLQTPFLGTNVQEIVKDVLDLSEAGLKRRNILDAQGRHEGIYLEPLQEIAASGRNWAQRLIERFDGVWGKSIDRVFSDMDYANEPSVLRAPVIVPARKKISSPRYGR